MKRRADVAQRLAKLVEEHRGARESAPPPSSTHSATARKGAGATLAVAIGVAALVALGGTMFALAQKRRAAAPAPSAAAVAAAGGITGSDYERLIGAVVAELERKIDGGTLADAESREELAIAVWRLLPTGPEGRTVMEKKMRELGMSSGQVEAYTKKYPITSGRILRRLEGGLVKKLGALDRPDLPRLSATEAGCERLVKLVVAQRIEVKDPGAAVALMPLLAPCRRHLGRREVQCLARAKTMAGYDRCMTSDAGTGAATSRSASPPDPAPTVSAR